MLARRPSFLLFTVTLLAVSQCLPVRPAIAGGKTVEWTRQDDAVIVNGTLLKPLWGESPEHLSVLRCEDGRFKPIPFQVDERVADGRFAFRYGREARADEDPRFDENDELVFLAADAGDRCLGKAFPKAAGVRLELEIDDGEGAKRWAYVFTYESGAPRSDEDYVNGIMDDERGVWRLEAKTYRIEQVKNAFYYNYLSLKKPNGEWSENLVDRLKIRAEATTFWGLIHIPVVIEEVYKQRIDAWNDGPVRVVALGKGYFAALRNSLKIPIRGESIVSMYPTHFLFPVRLQVPIDTDRILTDIAVRGVHEFTRADIGQHIRFYDEYNPPSTAVIIDGVVSQAERALEKEADRDWIALAGDDFGAVIRLLMPDEWRFLTRGLYHDEAPDAVDPPEADPGVFGVGYDIKGGIDIKRGDYTFYFQFIAPESFKLGDEKAALKVYDAPLEVRVYSLEPSAPKPE